MDGLRQKRRCHGRSTKGQNTRGAAGRGGDGVYAAARGEISYRLGFSDLICRHLRDNVQIGRMISLNDEALINLIECHRSGRADAAGSFPLGRRGLISQHASLITACQCPHSGALEISWNFCCFRA